MFSSRKSLAFRFVSDVLLVLRENKEPCRDEDWDPFLNVLVKNRENFANLKILVRTDGGSPTMSQRKRLAKALDGRLVRVAVVTDHTPTRFVVSSIALLNRSIRSFSTEELKSAYAHLSLAPIEVTLAEKAVQELNYLVDL